MKFISEAQKLRREEDYKDERYNPENVYCKSGTKHDRRTTPGGKFFILEKRRDYTGHDTEELFQVRLPENMFLLLVN